MNNKKIVLPKITSFELTGFQPIFNSDIAMTIGSGPNVVLGGNGLGKTTIMQAVIFCLTGGTSKIEDEEKRWRWDHKYFRDRLDQDTNMPAYVEVSFSFHANSYTVRRGFSSDRVIAFRDGKSEWVDSPIEAHESFKQAITHDGNYQSEEDFSFIVHRLIYLNESRRSLAWDIDAQLRTLMLLNQDIRPESDFRNKRREIKELDTQLRHTHVSIGKIQNQIDASKQTAPQPQSTTSAPEDLYKKLTKQLHSHAQKRISLETKAKESSDALSKISAELEELRDREETAEGSLVAQLLHEHESLINLPLNKLKDRGICPACGTKQKSLQDHALEYLQKHQCMLCGSDEPQAEIPQLSTLQSQIHEKVRAQKHLERNYLDISAQLTLTKSEINRLEFELSSHWYKLSDIALIERQEHVKMGEDPKV